MRLRLQELIAGNFKNEDIDELGSLLLRRYDSHEAAGEERHITISRRRGAQLLVEVCEKQHKETELVNLIVDIDGNQLLGRKIRVNGIEGFLNALVRSGYVYDPDRRRVELGRGDIKSLKNWGSLKDGRDYEVSVVSVDVVGNSALVREFGAKAMERLSYRLLGFLSRKLEEYDGRLWNWAGDGGIIAFALPDHQNRAVLCALAIQMSMPLFNIDPETPIARPVELRAAAHTGKVRFYRDTGRIVSDVINYTAHLEKSATRPGCVSISDTLYNMTCNRITAHFTEWGEFEGLGYRTVEQRLDTLLPLRLDAEEQRALSV